MKKICLLLSLMTLFLTPVIGQAASVGEESIAKTEAISPRAVYKYRFESIPPKKFNGMNRIYYEYDSKFGLYIGYYQ